MIGAEKCLTRVAQYLQLQCRLVGIINKTDTSIRITLAKKDVVVEKYTEMYFSSHLLNIPFISVMANSEYRQAFVLNRPYVPEGALEIRTHFGNFGLWQNEKGIVFARAYVSGQSSLDDCLEQVLVESYLLKQRDCSDYTVQVDNEQFLLFHQKN
jgi:hypothetical protein